MHRSSEILAWFNDLSPSRTASACSLNGGFGTGEQRSREDTKLHPGQCDVLTGGDAITELFVSHLPGRQEDSFLWMQVPVCLCVHAEARQFLRKKASLMQCRAGMEIQRVGWKG